MKKTILLFTLMLSTVFLFAQTLVNSATEADPNGSASQAQGTKGAWVIQFNYSNIPATGSAGSETDGNYIYVTQWSGDSIWKFSLTGTLIGGFKVPGVSGLRDLAYDGQYFYGGSSGNLIYQMDFDTTAPYLVGTIVSPTVTVRNICYQPDSDAFWVANWATDLTLVNRSGSVIRTIPSSTHGLASCYGTAYDDVSPGGPFIWAIDATGTSAALITQIDATTGAQTGITHFTTDLGYATSGGGLWIAPNIVGTTTTLGGIIQNEAIFGYDLASTVPDSLDLATSTIDVNTYVPLGTPLNIGGEILNNGLATITSFDLHYNIDGGATVTDNITGVNIAPNTTYNYMHTTAWTPVLGAHTINVWVSNPNGSPDQFTGNDTASTVVSVYDPTNTVQRLVMHEGFTSSTCGPCAPGNANVATVFNANPGKFTCVKYQMSWPSVSGMNGDPYYTEEGNYRRTYYGVNSVPRLEVDGGWDDNSNSYSSQLLNAAYAVPSFITINASYEVVNQTVSVYATVTPLIDFPDPFMKLHVAIIENTTYNNVGTNGESSFDYVMKKMIPNAFGTNIGPLTANTAVQFDGHHEFKGSYRLPSDADDPINHTFEHSVEEFTDLSVVVWVQSYTSKEIMQSTFATLNPGFDDEEASKSGIINLFPNPTNDQAYLRYLLDEQKEVSIEVYNVLGEVVYSVANGTEESGIHTATLNTSDLSQGVYIVKLRIGNYVYSKKLNVN